MDKSRAIKGFDCVKFKHDAQAKIMRDTKNMTSKQRVEYIHAQANSGELGKWWRGLGKRAAKAA